jgi:hypothetical protein
MVHRFDVALRPHASRKARVAMSDAVTTVAHEDDAGERIVGDFLDVGAERRLVRVDGTKVRIANRIQVYMRDSLREVLAYLDESHQMTALT